MTPMFIFFNAQAYINLTINEIRSQGLIWLGRNLFKFDLSTLKYIQSISKEHDLFNG